MSADRFAGHTPAPWRVVHDCGLCYRVENETSPYMFDGTFSKVDAQLCAAAPELLAENERLRADLARVSVEFGLPPTIGPAPGQITAMRQESARIRACLIKANSQADENERLRDRVAALQFGYHEAIHDLEQDAPQDTERHRAVLNGVVASIADYDAYLAAQLGGAQP
jgi:hypothetical protein